MKRMRQWMALGSSLLLAIAIAIVMGLTLLWLGPGGVQPAAGRHLALPAADFMQPDLEYIGPVHGADFARAVAGAGDLNGDGFADIVVGAPKYVPGNVYGAAFVFYGTAGGLVGADHYDWFSQGEQEGADYGTSVSSAGDVNKDGFDDLVVGAPGFGYGGSSTQLPDIGRVYLYLGVASGRMVTETAWTFTGDQRDTYLGRSLAAAGDVNADGYDDVLVGVPGYTHAISEAGRVYVFLGSEAGLTAALSATLDGLQTGEGFGTSVSGAGDLNHDGFDDIIIGAPYHNLISTTLDSGAAYVFFGSAGGISTGLSQTLLCDQAQAYFGFSVSAAGDVDGDGHREVVVGAPRYDNAGADVGAAFLYYGSGSGVNARSGWRATGYQAYGRFGAVVSGGSDLSQDGLDDVLVGAPEQSVSGPNSMDGAAYVFLGHAAGLADSWSWAGAPGKADADYGVAAAMAGDLNGDGVGDIVVGAPDYFWSDKERRGAVFTYLGAEYAPTWRIYLPMAIGGD